MRDLTDIAVSVLSGSYINIVLRTVINMKQEKPTIYIKTKKCLMGPWGLPLEKHYFYLDLVDPGYLERHYEKFQVKDATEISKYLHAYGPKSPAVINDIRKDLTDSLNSLRRDGYVPEKYNNDFICGRKYVYGSNEDEDYFVFIHAGQHRAACLAYLKEPGFRISCDERIEPIIDRTMK